MKHGTTTILTFKGDKEEVLSGEERYPIVGDAISEAQVADILQECKGLNKYWHCLEKAEAARRVVGKGHILMGAMLVFDLTYTSSYGYYWNPPYEFHAWLFLINPQAVIDVALPGVIEKGLNSYDKMGPAISGRQPIVLAGQPLRWTQYEAVQIYKP